MSLMRTLTPEALLMKHPACDFDFAACIGLDWADAKHDICLLPSGTKKVEASVLRHRPEDIDQWARELRARFDGAPVAVALELFKGPIVTALSQYDFFVLFPVNPATLAKYRGTWVPSGAKDDPSDAALALELLTRHGDKLKPLEPQSARMRTVVSLVESRRRLVDDQTRYTNRLTSALKNYYPQPLQWFKDKNTALFCDFLERWPTLKSVQQARRNTLQKFFNQHNVRYAHVIEQRIDDIRCATALTHDPGVIEPNALLIKALVAQLRATLAAIEQFNEEIERQATAHDDYELFASFPGAGPTFAPRLLAAFGEQRQRYRSANDIQKYAGVAPVTERSGNSNWVHWRWSCPTFIRQTFVEWAALTIPHSFWAKLFYQQQRSKGKTHQAAIRALAFKWLRIMHRCWITRTHYDEAAYLIALKKRGSTLLNQATAEA